MGSPDSRVAPLLVSFGRVRRYLAGCTSGSMPSGLVGTRWWLEGVGPSHEIRQEHEVLPPPQSPSLSLIITTTITIHHHLHRLHLQQREGKTRTCTRVQAQEVSASSYPSYQPRLSIHSSCHLSSSSSFCFFSHSLPQ